MSKSQSKDIQFLLQLSRKARDEITNLVTELSPQGSIEALEVCLAHIEKIGMEADVLGLTSLDTIAADIHTHFGADSGVLTQQLGADLLNWLDNVISHIESPDNCTTLESLLKPLPAELRPEIRTTLDLPQVEEVVDAEEMVVVEDDIASTENIEPDDPDSPISAKAVVADGFPIEITDEDETVVSDYGGIDINNIFEVAEETGDSEFADRISDGDESVIDWPCESDGSKFLLGADEDAKSTFPTDATGEDADAISNSSEFDMSIFDEDGDNDFGDDSLLGILASELKEVSPQVSELALTLASTEDTGELIEAIGAYQEVVYRVAAVSEGLGLHGLVLVADFVGKNALQMAELALADRANCVEVLQGWPDVIINHLTQPKDDTLCHAVVDYLEKDNWPQPLPYRDVRDLIEGLTKELEMTGDYAIILPLMLATVLSTVVARVISRESIYTLKLTRRGISLEKGLDAEVLAGVRVVEVMSTNMVAVNLDLPLPNLNGEFNRARDNTVPVIDENGQLAGIVSTQDLDRALSRGSNEGKTVREVATLDNLLVAFPDDSIGDALKRVNVRGLTMLPVVDAENPKRLLGIVTHDDLRQAYSRGVSRRARQLQRATESGIEDDQDMNLIYVDVPDAAKIGGSRVSTLELPLECLIVSLEREGHRTVVHGDTRIESGDRVAVVVSGESAATVRELLTRKQATSSDPN